MGNVRVHNYFGEIGVSKVRGEETYNVVIRVPFTSRRHADELREELVDTKLVIKPAPPGDEQK